MAEERIEFKIIVDDTGALVGLRSVNKEFKDIDLTTKNAKSSVEALNQAIGNTGKGVNVKSIKITSEEYQKLIKTQNQLKNSSGAATSAALELARVVQDAPYGIRGMGNNITQLASQLAFATKDAGGFVGALKQMGSAMIGPLGIVFAISAVVSYFDFMYGAQKKVKEATEETTEALKDQDEILVLISSNYLKFGKNKELNDYYSRALIQRSPKLKKILEDENKSQEEKNKAISDFVRLKELEIDNENRLIKVKELKVSLDEKEKEIREKYSKDLAGVKGTKAEANLITKMNKEISNSTINTRNSIEESLSDYIAFSSEIQRLESILFPKEEKKSTREIETVSLSVFDENVFDAESITLLGKINDLNQQIELLSAETEEDKLNIKLKWLQIGLKEEEVARIDALEKDYQDYENNLTKKYDKEEEKNKELLAKGKTTQNEFDAWQQNAVAKVLELSNVAEQNKDVGVQAIMDEYEKLIKKYEELYGIRLKALGMSDDEDEKSKEFDALSSYIESYKVLMGGLTDFINGEFERQLTIEQNKTNALNEELNNRLINENLSKEQRASIQNEIARNDEALRKKQDEIAKKKFQTEKAFNISTAIIDTYAGATRALNDKTVPSTIARFALAGATIASGLLQVASIARQKFQSSSASTPIRTSGGGGSGAGMGDRSFNFNLVGNNRENQLVNAIQGQFNQPLKAYVVSRDMSNQQQLDANIVNSARF
jgi:hypothetical protein